MPHPQWRTLCTKKEWRAAAKRVGHANPEASALDSALFEIMQSQADQQGLSLTALFDQRALEAERLRHLRSQKQELSLQKYRAKQAHKLARPGQWNVWFDGSAKPNPGACRCGALLRSPQGQEWHYSVSLGNGSSSDAEYQALIAALELALQHGARVLYVFGDSRVILDDVQASIAEASAVLSNWREQALALVAQFETVHWCWITTALNGAADQLASGN